LTFSTNILKLIQNIKFMLGIFVFIFVVYGVTNIIVFGTIFDKPREFLMRINPGFLGKLMTCPLCSATWVGFLLSFTLYTFGLSHLSPCGSWGITVPWLAIFLDGCLASGTTWILHTLQEYFQYNTPQENE